MTSQIAAAGLAVLFCTSCSSEYSPMGAEEAQAQAQAEVQRDLGVGLPNPSYEEAKVIADSRIKIGMTQDDVQWLLGMPDKAGKKVYGAATQTPWEGTEWEYDWIAPDGVGKVLLVVFQNDGTTWRVRIASWV